jgi:hypothetical protein
MRIGTAMFVRSVAVPDWKTETGFSVMPTAVWRPSEAASR